MSDARTVPEQKQPRVTEALARFRWFHPYGRADTPKVLQQANRDVSTGEILWLDVPSVFADLEREK